MVYSVKNYLVKLTRPTVITINGIYTIALIMHVCAAIASTPIRLNRAFGQHFHKQLCKSLDNGVTLLPHLISFIAKH